jgi:hypothetical protein
MEFEKSHFDYWCITTEKCQEMAFDTCMFVDFHENWPNINNLQFYMCECTMPCSIHD